MKQFLPGRNLYRFFFPTLFNELLMPETSDVLTVEFKVNFLKPASSKTILAIGKVIQRVKH